MKFITHNDGVSINIHEMTYQGFVRTSHSRLVKVLGKPMEGDPRWAIRFSDGLALIIYLYSDAPTYGMGGSLLSWRQYKTWHIGGTDPKVVKRIQKLLSK